MECTLQSRRRANKIWIPSGKQLNSTTPFKNLFRKVIIRLYAYSDKMSPGIPTGMPDVFLFYFVYLLMGRRFND